MHQKHTIAKTVKNELQSASKTEIAKQQNDLQNCKVHQKHKLRKQ